MTKIIGTVAATLLALAVSEGKDTPPKPNDPVEKILIANERALYDAVGRADRTSFQSLVLPEGVWTTKTGFVPMRLLVDGLDTFQLPKWDIVNPHVTWTDRESGIVLYSRTGGGTFGGQPFAAVSLASTVWTKRHGKWLAVHHQETDLTR